MEKNFNILSELKELEAATLITISNQNCYFLPGDYFNNLSDNIKAQVFIQSLPGINPYKIPENYFENFADIVLEKMQLETNTPGLNTVKQPVYKVPEGYFENFADVVLQKIKYSTLTVQQELEEISPLLHSISKTNVYTVPENYFNHLEVLPKQETLPGAKVVSIGSKTRKWFGYAAAACVAAVLFGGGYSYFSGNNANVVVQSTSASIAKIDFQKEISTLSDDEINSYLDNNSNMAVYTNINDADQQPKMDVQTLLQNVSDEEIQQYLNQDPETGKSGEGI